MLSNTTLILDSRKYPAGFVLVVAAAPNDDLCGVVEEKSRCKASEGSPSLLSEVVKNITITVIANSEEKDYIIGTLVISGIYLAIFVISSAISAYVFTYEYHKFEDLAEMIREKLLFKQKQETQKIKSLSMIMAGKENGRKWLELLVREQAPTIPDQNSNIEFENQELLEPELFIDDDELDNFGIGGLDSKYKVRMKRDLTLADLTLKINDPTQVKSMYDKSDLHWVMLVIISVYYSLPTMQMVLDSNTEYDETGNHDLCYYNHLCQKPLGEMRDFNHLFSNLGYIVFGLLFNCLVFLKGRNFKSLSTTGQKFDPHLHGVPHQTGLYYAMGSALIMEGIMSSCYHVCPATVTFQFDTTYMYLIAILMFLKLYQGRHPDVSCDAFKSYMGLGVALTLEVILCYELPYLHFSFRHSHIITMELYFGSFSVLSTSYSLSLLESAPTILALSGMISRFSGKLLSCWGKS